RPQGSSSSGWTTNRWITSPENWNASAPLPEFVETAADYLKRTESAARKLFEGIESYLERLQRAVPPVFVSSGANRQQADVELEAWKKRHDAEIKASLAAQ